MIYFNIRLPVGYEQLHVNGYITTQIDQSGVSGGVGGRGGVCHHNVNQSLTRVSSGGGAEAGFASHVNQSLTRVSSGGGAEAGFASHVNQSLSRVSSRGGANFEHEAADVLIDR